MKKLISNHLFELGTAVLSIFALILAIQANAYSKQANQIALSGNQISADGLSPQVEVYSNYGTGENDIIVSGCLKSDEGNFQVKRAVYDFFVFINHAGHKVSLTRISFSEGNTPYAEIKVDYLDPATSGIQALSLPQEIDTALLLSLEAINTSSWNTIPEALSIIRYPDPTASKLPETMKPTLWKFEFSDGTAIIYEYKTGWYHIQPNIDQHLQKDSCSGI